MIRTSASATMRQTHDGRCRRHTARHRAGFSLPELAGAIVILAIAIPPMTMVFAEVGSHTILSERQTTAYFLAMERLEEIIADRHAPARGFAWLSGANYPDETFAGGFTRRVTFTEVSPDNAETPRTGSGHLRITVTVSYAAPAGSVSLHCVASRFS